MNNLDEFENKINIQFKNKTLLENVFIHRSYLNEHKNSQLSSNEKLEFLGDSVLSLITSMYLYETYPLLAEGEYTEIKAAIVRTESLSEVARKLELGEYLFLSRGQNQEGGRENMNILADTFEALIAAISIDRGFDEAYKFVLKYLFENKLDYIVTNKLYMSPKSRLQEYTQAKHKVTPVYKVLSETGPEHKRFFKVSVSVDQKVLGSGMGKSKKEAEEAAAKLALEKLTVM